MPKVLRHFTSQKNLKNILREKVLRTKRGKIYFPTTRMKGSAAVVSEKLGIHLSKAKVYIDINVEELDVVRKYNPATKHTDYLIEGPVDITNRIVSISK